MKQSLRHFPWVTASLLFLAVVVYGLSYSRFGSHLTRHDFANGWVTISRGDLTGTRVLSSRPWVKGDNMAGGGGNWSQRKILLLSITNYQMVSSPSNTVIGSFTQYDVPLWPLVLGICIILIWKVRTWLRTTYEMPHGFEVKLDSEVQ